MLDVGPVGLEKLNVMSGKRMDVVFVRRPVWIVQAMGWISAGLQEGRSNMMSKVYDAEGSSHVSPVDFLDHDMRAGIANYGD